MNALQSGVKIPALFLHIQKTAGTSIVQMAARHYGNSNVASHGDFLGKEAQEFVGTSFVSGHFGYDYAKPLMQDRYTFTFLRDPIERVLSFYCFCRSRDPEEHPIYRVASEYDLDDFIRAAVENEQVKKSIWNSQVWRLASGPGSVAIGDMSDEEMLALAIAHLNDFSYVGFTESFDDDARAILRDLHITCDDIPAKVNVTEGRMPAADVPVDILTMIEGITQLDKQLYDAAWSLRG